MNYTLLISLTRPTEHASLESTKLCDLQQWIWQQHQMR